MKKYSKHKTSRSFCIIIVIIVELMYDIEKEEVKYMDKDEFELTKAEAMSFR